MATATAALPSGAAARQPLWEGLPIEVIVGTGEYSSGKSLYGLTICPGPETLVFDNEGSNTIYRSLGFEHVDMAAELMRKHPSGYTAEHRYLWWREAAVQHGKSGNFRVLMVDPFSEIEQGLAQYVEKNPEKYGYTAGQFKSSKGLFWAAVKDALKADLDRLRVLFDTVYLTVHMRNEFKGHSPTGRREPKGKETLFELASLFLLFRRDKDEKGVVPDVPSADVLKSRLASTRITPEGVQIVPILPPRLPKATPAAIREYIRKPPDYSKLKKEERLVDEKMSDDARLMLQASIAESNREAAAAELEREQIRSRAAAAQAAAIASVRPAVDQSADNAEKVAERAKSNAAPCTAQQEADIRAILPKAYGNDPTPFKTRLEDYGVSRIADLTESQAIDLYVDLTNLAAARATMRANEMAASAPASKPAVTVPVAPAHANHPAGPADPFDTEGGDEGGGTDDADEQAERASPTAGVTTSDNSFYALTLEQDATIRRLMRTSRIVPQVMADMLGRYGKSKIAELTGVEAHNVILALEERAAAVTSSDECQPLLDGQEPNGSVTNEQVAKLNELVQLTGWAQDKREEYLKRLKIGSFRSMTIEQAAELIGKLQGVADSFAAKRANPGGK